MDRLNTATEVVPEELTLEDFKEVAFDEDLYDMGFRGIGRLADYQGYEDENERHWVVEHLRTGQHVVFFDKGNGHCNVVKILTGELIKIDSSDESEE